MSLCTSTDCAAAAADEMLLALSLAKIADTKTV